MRRPSKSAGGRDRHKRQIASARKRSQTVAVRAAGEADRRGGRVARTPRELTEAAALDARIVGEALIAQHNRRMMGIATLTDELRTPVLESMLPVVTINLSLRGLLRDRKRFPASFGSTWPENLDWGVQSAVSTIRMLLCGQVIGAAALARNQLERWTADRAHLAQVVKNADEAEQDFIARAWSSPIHEELVKQNRILAVAFDGDAGPPQVEPAIDHAHVFLRDGRAVCPALVWIYLSEILHGRLATQAVEWELEGCLRGEVPEDVHLAYAAILDSIGIGLNHMRRTLETIHADRRDLKEVAYLRGTADTYSDAKDDAPHEAPFNLLTEKAGLAAPSLPCLMPLTPEEGGSCQVK